MPAPPEVADIPSHPGERRLLVQDAVVGEEMAFGIDRGMRHESEQTQAVVDRDYDNVALRRELGAVVVVASAVDVSASMDPDKDWQQFFRRRMNVRAVDV